ncbi:MAG: aminotransferase class I/II-fold pyridoxal phosphate-dependent enzyme [Roseburia sp.]
MQYLDEKLIEYGRSNMYPFHMPGHKRKQLVFPNPYAIDITEIDGFDYLSCADGILMEAQQRAARLYDSLHCHYLVNGSTCGILAAICAATKKRDTVLVARNCHKSVYHALELHELTAQYLYPCITKEGLQGQITAAQVKEALCDNPAIRAVIVTSPTYEGVISDIRGIAEEAHAFGIPLIVDEAHGAHLGFGAGFPENAVRLGADAVIMSLHKTLPSFTQTALLHINSERIANEKVSRYLEMFQTSSPSYLLMAGMDSCIRLLLKEQKKLFADYRAHLDCFYETISGLKNLHVLAKEDFTEDEAFAWDDSKLVIFSGKSGRTGEELRKILRREYALEFELASGCYVLGMTSIMDAAEGFERLAEALFQMDAVLADEEPGRQPPMPVEFMQRTYQRQEKQLEIYEAISFAHTEVSFSEAVGRLSAAYLTLYPPGIPMLVPGERITERLLENIRECKGYGLPLRGLPDSSLERIKIVYF